jgi:Fe-Mn family superoxide dismutase
MKKTQLFLSSLVLAFVLQSCNKEKKLEEVEVPLPVTEEKAPMGNPDDVAAETGSF